MRVETLQEQPPKEASLKSSREMVNVLDYVEAANTPATSALIHLLISSASNPSKKADPAVALLGLLPLLDDTNANVTTAVTFFSI